MEIVILLPQRIAILSQTRIHSLTGIPCLIIQLNITTLMTGLSTSHYICLRALVLAPILVQVPATLMTDCDLNLL